MKCFRYKGTSPIGCNKNGLINPIKEIAQRNRDTSSLGFKKVPFHLGINKFVLEPDSSFENESQAESNNQEDNDDDEDPYPYPIPYDLSRFFYEPDDFIPWVATVGDTSDSSEENTEQPTNHLEKEESGHSLSIVHLCKNPDDKGEYVPITIGEFYSLSPYGTDSREYKFDSLLEVTTNKDIDQVHVYENQLEVVETSRVRWMT
jgi:hypothetical protein